MTSLLHVSVTYYVLLSFQSRHRRCFRPVCAHPRCIYQRFVLSAFYLSPHCTSCASNGTTTRFCIYIQPFVIVCKAVARACHARFCQIGRTRRGLRRPDIAARPGERVTVYGQKESGRCVRTFIFFFFFLFNARFGRMCCVNLVARLISCNTGAAPFCINFAPSIYSQFALANGTSGASHLASVIKLSHGRNGLITRRWNA